MTRRRLADFVCNTSPLQYLHQLGQLDLLRALAAAVFIPPAVVREIAIGVSLGINLPDLTSMAWISVRTPQASARTPWRGTLGPGETEVLQLALEMPRALLLLDDRRARQAAASLQLPLKGTIGLLVDAKHAGLIPAIRPLLDQLDALGFRLAHSSRVSALRLAGEVAP